MATKNTKSTKSKVNSQQGLGKGEVLRNAPSNKKSMYVDNPTDIKPEQGVIKDASDLVPKLTKEQWDKLYEEVYGEGGTCGTIQQQGEPK